MQHLLNALLSGATDISERELSALREAREALLGDARECVPVLKDVFSAIATSARSSQPDSYLRALGPALSVALSLIKGYFTQ